MYQNIVRHIRILGLEHSDDALDEAHVQVTQTGASHVHENGNLVQVTMPLQTLNPEDKDAQ